VKTISIVSLFFSQEMVHLFAILGAKQWQPMMSLYLMGLSMSVVPTGTWEYLILSEAKMRRN